MKQPMRLSVFLPDFDSPEKRWNGVCAVLDPTPPPPPSSGANPWTNFSQILRENERNWTQQASLALPPPPPRQRSVNALDQSEEMSIFSFIIFNHLDDLWQVVSMRHFQISDGLFLVLENVFWSCTLFDLTAG